MCGIAGIYGETGAASPHAVARMRDTLAHRGPDSAGVYVSPDERVAFGFRRLSIVDLSDASNQPFRSRDGRFVIVLNGEVFNFRQLRQELERCGCHFRSEGDAEVALSAYMQFGHTCVNRFHGMFALAIWDQHTRVLFLARDRFGIKPLYYYWDGRTFLFASELRALLLHPAVSRAIDPDALLDYLTYGYVPAPRAMVRGVKKLLPAHWLRVSDEGVQSDRYWSLTYNPLERTDTTLSEELQSRMEEAVGLWMVSDVEVGAFLSGGLDSTSVCCLAKSSTPAELRTFSIGFDDPRQDETSYARIAAAAVGTRHAERRVTLDDARAGLGAVARTYDEPMVDTSTVPTIHVSAFAAESVRVVLTGDGADELFFGYGWYKQLLAWRTHRHGAPLDPAVRRIIGWSRGIPGLARIAALERLTATDVVRQYFLLRGFFDEWEKRQLLGESATRQQEDLWLLRQHFDPHLPLEVSLRLLDIHTYLSDDILPKVDRASMAYSLEARTPFLEHSLAEFAMTIPAAHVFRNEQLKHTVKAAMRDRLPSSILERGKRGFSAPIVRWFDGPFADEALQTVCNGYAARDGVFNPRFVRWMVANYTKGRWYRLWQLLIFETWYRRWILDLRDAADDRVVAASNAPRDARTAVRAH